MTTTAAMTPPTLVGLALLSGSPDLNDQAAARAARPGCLDWLDHVRPAAGCARPIRLHGDILTIDADTGRLLSTVHTSDMPDGVIYKACGNRRASACPSCSQRYWERKWRSTTAAAASTRKPTYGTPSTAIATC